MTLTPMCLCFLLRESSEGGEILLGRKQLGFGTGNIIGLGGHVEPGEDESAAAIRETWEESGLLVNARYWIPGVIAGGRVMATFEFASNCRTVAHADVRTTPR